MFFIQVADSRTVKHRINFRVKLAPGLASLDDDEDEKTQDDGVTLCMEIFYL